MCFLGRHSRWTGIVVAGLTLLGGAVTAPAVAAPAVAGPAVAAAALAPAAPRVSAAPLGADAQWSAPAPLPAGTAAGLASSARPSVLDCAGTGSCSALGSADDPSSAYGDSEAFVDNQVDGSWLRPRLLPGLAALDTGFPASVLTLSCSTAGDCAAGGFYAHPRSSDFDLRQGFIVTEKNGSWGSAENVPGLSALNTADYAAVSSISCTAPGYCTAAGFYTIGVPLGAEDGGTFTVQEVAGTWQQARPVPGLSGLATSGESVACAAPGDCTVVGSNEAAKQTFTLREIGSRWGAVQTIKKMTSIYPPSLSCSGSGDCAVASGNQVASSTGGVWSAAATVGGSGLDLGALSCGSPGDCLAGGYNQAGVLSNPYAVTIGQHAGTWGAVSAVPGINAVSHGGDSNVSAISCAAAASCQVGGGYVVNPTASPPAPAASSMR